MKKANFVAIDTARDSLLTEFGKETLLDRYTLSNESIQGLFSRVAARYGDDSEHAQRLYDYMSSQWFMPSTPVLSNGGAGRGLPIACYLNEVEDTMEGIIECETENFWLSAKGGGIGTYWGNVRSVGEQVKQAGKSGGIIPWICVGNAMSQAVSQGTLRPGSRAYFLPIHHPEIHEFLTIRKATGGDASRKALNIHHGIVIDDEFMKAVQAGTKYALRSPKDMSVISYEDARALWAKILTIRLETGEPYLIFKDNINKAIPEHHKKLGLLVKTSNLCSEITLPTGKDYLGRERTAVCCLSSLNLEHFDKWKEVPHFIEDVLRFLDNVLQDFIDNAPDAMQKAKYAAMMERSVGLGVMGFHSYLQDHMIPWESALARSFNFYAFKHIQDKCKEANEKLGFERGANEDEIHLYGHAARNRFSNMTAIAPTASISTICGNASPGIEPIAANAYTHKTKSGNYTVKNKYLDKLILQKLLAQDVKREAGEIVGQPWEKKYNILWQSINMHEGSIQHLDAFFTQDERDVFKTAREINQKWLIEFAADRTPFIDQSQSVNLFLPSNIHKRELSDLHFSAWKKGMKSLYYLRSMSLQRAEKSYVTPETEECLGCQ